MHNRTHYFFGHHPHVSGVMLIVFTLLFLGACSNFLSDPLINPDHSRINKGSTSLVPVFTGDVGEGETTSFSNVILQITWPEPVEDFSLDDLVFENSAIGEFSGSGDTYTVELVLTGEGVISLTIPERATSGISGNTNQEFTFSFTRIATDLSLSITSDESPSTSSATIPVSFLFSEDVTGFDASDVSSDNGSLSGFSGTGDSYTATFTFDGDGFGTISVPAAAAVDLATGAKENESDVLAVYFDSGNPSVVLSSSISHGGLAGYNSLIFTIEFSEEVTELDAADLAVSNGILSEFSGDGDTYQVRVTALNDGQVSLQVPADAASDIVGNGNTASSEFLYTYDSSSVAVNLSSSESDPSNAASIEVEIVFDKAMYGFDESDIVPTNGVLSGFLDSGDGQHYSVTLTPFTDGTSGLSIGDAAALSQEGDYPNVASSFEFLSDRTAPVQPGFSVKGYDTGLPIADDDVVGEFLYVQLTTDYSGDSGSNLSFQYTKDSGSTWHPFVDMTPITAQGSYSGINIRTLDAAGNSTDGTALTNIAIDTVDPDAPLPQIDTDPVNAGNAGSFGLTVTGGEASAALEYELFTDSGTPGDAGDDQYLAGGPFAGSFNASGEAVFSNINLASLNDGNLTVRVHQTDEAGNTGGWGQDSVVKDTLIPTAPTVTILNGDPVTSTGNDNFMFDISGGEEGLSWKYTISSSGGGPEISATGVFPATGKENVSGIDISALRDGTLTVTCTQEDDAENISTAGSDTVTLDATALNIINLPDLVNTDNVDSVPIELIAEVGSSYEYTVSSSNGGSPGTILGSGGYDGSGEASFNLDLINLNDGWIVVAVNVTDINGNESSEFAVMEKASAGPPAEGPAVFSAAGTYVTFDASYHGYQTTPLGSVRYDLTGYSITNPGEPAIIGSIHDDVFLFSALEAGEEFVLDAGAGFNTIDLSNYSAANIVVESGVTGTEDGYVLIYLDGGTARIDFTDVQYFRFSAIVFDGTPHALVLDATSDQQWVYAGMNVASFTNLKSLSIANTGKTTIEARSTVTGDLSPAIPLFSGTLATNYTLEATFRIISETGRWSNANLLFDYEDIGNYKRFGMSPGVDEWRLFHVIDGDKGSVLESFYEDLSNDADFSVELRVTGTDGQTAEIWSGPEGFEESKLTHPFIGDNLNDGLFGVATNNSYMRISLDMGPSNWAPYARNYNMVLVKSAVSELTLDLIGDAVDAEGEALSLSELSTSSNGTLVDNGNGTVTYMPNVTFLGVDNFTYEITDGSNTTEGSIRVDVMP